MELTLLQETSEIDIHHRTLFPRNRKASPRSVISGQLRMLTKGLSDYRRLHSPSGVKVSNRTWRRHSALYQHLLSNEKTEH